MNCKPGDMAITVKRGAWADNPTPGIIGRVVEVVRLVAYGEVFVSTTGAMFRLTSNSPAWVVRSREPLPWMSHSGPNAGEVHFFHERPIADACLIPIGGVPVHDEQCDEVTA